jgi:hypothetical protein
MSVAQIAERETLYRRILELPEEDFGLVKQYVDDLEAHEPNEETLDACRELREGRGIKFASAEEMFTNMGFADAYARSIGKI